jgi:lipopolysaccharide export system permease protein
VKLSKTYSWYLGRQYLMWFGCTLLLLLVIIALFDFIELLRRTAAAEAPLTTVASMSLYKLPHMAEKAAPFAALFGAMYAFWRFNRHNEVVVARSSGVSVWQFLFPVLVAAAGIGAIKIMVFNPVATAALLRYEQLEAKYIRGKSSLAAVADKGFWLRQVTDTGHYVLHAREVSATHMLLRDVMVLLMRDTDTFVGRIDAPVAMLERGYWTLHDARLSTPDAPPRPLLSHRIETDITAENIQDSFAPPETVSFWALPAFIGVLERAGFSALRHRLHWYAQTADPILLCAMVLLAATFSLRPIRRGGTAVRMVGGVITGFVLYFLSDVVSALGVSARIPVALAAWSPATISCLLGTAMLLHLEDG